MKNLQFVTNYTSYDSIDELEPQAKHLLEEAVSARKRAYAPYSNFSVGAAILLDNDKIITGNNQENAAYPSGLCAERVAIFNAGANHPESKVLIMAISASSSKNKVNEPVAPCGACRQSISEYEIKQNTAIQIYFMGETGGIIRVDSLGALLPLSFDKSLL